jgi:formate hydrogenlyase transcriptional activator
MLEPDRAQRDEPLGDTNRDHNSPVHLIVLGLIAAGGYYVGALIGFALTFPDNAVSGLWPPNAILLACLLLTPTRTWWVMLAGVLPAHLAVQLQTGVPLLMVLCWFISNSAEALIGAFCVRYFIRGPLKFDSFHHAGIFTTFAVIFSPFVTSFLDAGFVVLNQWRQDDFWEIWQMRFFANVLAALTLVPAIVLWIRNGVASLRTASLIQSTEAFALVAGLLSGVFIVFTWQSAGPNALPALAYMPLPFLLWAAVRFGPLGSSACLLILVLLSIWETAHGQGPFISSTPEENVFFLQLFLIVVSVPLFFLAALLEERRGAEQTRAEAAAIVESSNDAIIGCTFDGIITTWNRAAEKLYGYSAEEAVGQPVAMLIPLHRGDVVTQIGEKIKRGEGVQSFEGVRIAKGGKRIDVSITVSAVTDTKGRMVGLSSIARDITDRKRAEEALRESEKRLARTEEFSLVMVTHTDLEGRWLKVPPTLCKLLGYTEGELLGRYFQELTHPDDVKNNVHQRLRLFRGEIKSFDIEKRYICKDGGIVWVSVNVSVVTDAKGIPIHCLSYIRDITERKRAEEALRESEVRYRTLAESATDVIVTIDQNSTVLFVNAAVEKTFGYAPAELIGEKLTMLMPEPLRHRHEQAVGRYLDTGEKNLAWNSVSFPGLHKSGREISLDISFAECRIGERRLFSGIMRDVTDRKRTEQALRESDERLRLALEAGGMGVWHWNRDAGTLYWSKELFTIMGLAPFSVEPTYHTWASCVYAEDLPHARAAMERAIVEIKEYQCEYRVCLPDNTIRWVESWGTPIFDKSDQCIGLRGLIVDVTERKRSEEALRAALREVQQLKLRLEADNVYLREELSQTHRYGQIIGESEEIKKVFEQVGRVARTHMTVLVLGETGVGKELVARLVHEKSGRRERPLVKVNCSTLPAELIESELFGHEKGAFTGAVARQVGRFELADGGTIFLDEVGELPLRLQAKLLRVLQEGEFERLGSGKTIKVDVRVIAATNRNLSEAAQRGRFRTDLYYRLNVYPIVVPPLRERTGDIRLLAEVFLREAGRRLGKSFGEISNETIAALQAYNWPGNVRELENVISRAAVVSAEASALLLPEGWNKAAGAEVSSESSRIVPEPFMLQRERPEPVPTLAQFERTRILEVLRQTNWRIEGPKGAAVILGLHPNTLRSRLHKQGISKPMKLRN